MKLKNIIFPLLIILSIFLSLSESQAQKITGLNCPTNNSKATMLFRLGMNFVSQAEDMSPKVKASLYKYALTYFKAATEEDPEFCDAWDQLATGFFYMDSINAALDAVNHSLESAPLNSQALMILTRIYIHQKEYDKAKATTTRLSAASGTKASAWFDNAVLCFTLNDYENARRHLLRAQDCYRIYGDYAISQDEIYILEAFLDCRAGNFIHANQTFNKVDFEKNRTGIKSDPQTFYYRGLSILNAKHDTAQAKKLFTIAKRIGFPCDTSGIPTSENIQGH